MCVHKNQIAQVNRRPQGAITSYEPSKTAGEFYIILKFVWQFWTKRCMYAYGEKVVHQDGSCKKFFYLQPGKNNGSRTWDSDPPSFKIITDGARAIIEAHWGCTYTKMCVFIRKHTHTHVYLSFYTCNIKD